MKRILSLMMALCVLAAFALPLCCAAAPPGSEPAEPTPELDKGFDLHLATTLILIICSVVLVVLFVILMILAKRNMHN